MFTGRAEGNIWPEVGAPLSREGGEGGNLILKSFFKGEKGPTLIVVFLVIK